MREMQCMASLQVTPYEVPLNKGGFRGLFFWHFYNPYPLF